MKIAYNTLWITPTFPVEGNVLPSQIEGNIAHIASINPHADIFLWIDSCRLKPEQIALLKQRANSLNFQVRDLREIESYRELRNEKGEHFFDMQNDAPREDKNAIIWRQVDLARIMASLAIASEGYDQIFYADADIKNLNTASLEVKNIMKAHGVLLCAGWCNGSGFENSILAFSKQRLNLINKLLQRTTHDVIHAGINGFIAFRDWATDEVMPALGITDEEEIAFRPKIIAGKPVSVDFVASTSNEDYWQNTTKKRGDIPLS